MFFKLIRNLVIAGVFLSLIGLILWISTHSFGTTDESLKLVMQNGKVVGAATVGEKLSEDNYFWGRPSASDFQSGALTGSKKQFSDALYYKEVEARIDTFIRCHPYLKRTEVPVELVTASNINNDPYITSESAYIQVKRVAKARKLSEKTVQTLVEDQIELPFLGLFGQPKVNVMKLNMALDNVK